MQWSKKQALDWEEDVCEHFSGDICELRKLEQIT